MQICRGKYKQVDCFVLKDGELAVTVLPRGGKFQSFVYRGKEYLLQNDARLYKVAEYGSNFGDGDFSGFDEMFPTISACAYPDGAYRGRELPDHGEVWAMDWECEIDGEWLKLSARGKALPYLIKKRVTLRESELIVQYTAQNTSGEPLKYIWAAHPLFILEEGTRLFLPGTEEIINAHGAQKYLGDFGEHHPYPVTKDGRDLTKLSPSEKCCAKYYVWNKRQKNDAVISYPCGTKITMNADNDAKYMGVWADEDGFDQNPTKCIAPEPCTGTLDRIDLADIFGKCSTLSAKGQADWTLRITFDHT